MRKKYAAKMKRRGMKVVNPLPSKKRNRAVISFGVNRFMLLFDIDYLLFCALLKSNNLVKSCQREAVTAELLLFIYGVVFAKESQKREAVSGVRFDLWRCT